MKVFKCRFGDYLSMAKARCEWDAVKLDPTTQKQHEFSDKLQKTAKEAFGTQAQQFIDKEIYAKMPDHVQKILNSPMSWSDYNMIKMNSENCPGISDNLQPPFKIECANAQLQQPIATADIQFNIGTDVHVHRYIRHSLENVLHYDRIKLHEKSSSSH